jgi:quinol monooxygenase YgiN
MNELTTIVIAYEAVPGKADIARDELAALIKIVVLKEPDCRGIHLLQDPADPHKILLIEYWTDADVFRGPHLTTPHLTAFRARAGAFLAGPPTTTFWSPVVAAMPS